MPFKCHRTLELCTIEQICKPCDYAVLKTPKLTEDKTTDGKMWRKKSNCDTVIIAVLKLHWSIKTFAFTSHVDTRDEWNSRNNPLWNLYSQEWSRGACFQWILSKELISLVPMKSLDGYYLPACWLQKLSEGYLTSGSK